jgi:hypothetical protein
MQGFRVTESGNMDHLNYESEGGPWVPIPGDYPRFAWELEAEGRFEVDVIDTENVTAGEDATVEVQVTSRYRDPDTDEETQTIRLMGPSGQTVDTERVTLESSSYRDDQTTIELVWQTSPGDQGLGDVTVHSEQREDSAPIQVTSPDHTVGRSGGPGYDGTPGDSIDDGTVGDPGPGEAGDGLDLEIEIEVDTVEIN